MEMGLSDKLTERYFSLMFVQPTNLPPANSADVGIATPVIAGELHVVLLVRARDPLHAAASLIGEPGYSCVDVGSLIAICVRFAHCLITEGITRSITGLC